MKEASNEPVDPVSLIHTAITKELMDNPHCPMARMMTELLQKHNQGDAEALNLALEIAKESLTPKRSLWERIKAKSQKL
ncbi:MAG: hypothetical protein UX13_C0026G0036 [Candidatus Woesebacteria bacterium GW2011_GWB1_45_5]|uniref:Uncharacterized protein n=1 Tax=Candidatus Woesebacteria bacterium GW2011_GWB1_45_5 TaxID=1618581 RepID=A0A0G1QMN6_9BACT|nr:MAG: hypothetical protein UX13_C0026G0036 [Candidatus Woesebacteria bacterium GW2011_GWB1_45_5]